MTKASKKIIEKIGLDIFLIVFYWMISLISFYVIESIFQISRILSIISIINPDHLVNHLIFFNVFIFLIMMIANKYLKKHIIYPIISFTSLLIIQVLLLILMISSINQL